MARQPALCLLIGGRYRAHHLHQSVNPGVPSAAQRALTSRGLEVARSIIALADVNAVLATALKRLVQRYRRAKELLLDLTQAVKPRLQLQMVVAIALGNGGDDSDVVPFRANVVSGRDDSDVYVCDLVSWSQFNFESERGHSTYRASGRLEIVE